MVCRPTLQTTMKVFNPDGTSNQGSMVDGNLSWSQITPESKIQYTIKTYPTYDTSRPLSEAGGGSDRVSFQVWRSDSDYLKQKANDAYAGATEEQQNIMVDEIIAVIQGTATTMPVYSAAIAKISDPDHAITLAHSKSITTDSSGEYVGEYKIPKSAKWGEYAFNFVYGYNHSDDKSEAERLREVTKDIFLAAVVAVVAILTVLAVIELAIFLLAGKAVAFTASSAVIAKLAAIGGTTGVVATTAFTAGYITADILFQNWLLESQGGISSFMNVAGLRAASLPVGNNKSGCDFIGSSGSDIRPVVQTYGAIVAPFAYLDADGELQFSNLKPDPSPINPAEKVVPLHQDPRFIMAVAFVAAGTILSLKDGEDS